MPITSNTPASQERQLDLFRIALPPCGRGLGACEAQLGATGAGELLCVHCGCVAPVKANGDA
jgi:hypothetical protein